MPSRIFIWAVALAALSGAPANAADKCKDAKCPPPPRQGGRPAQPPHGAPPPRPTPMPQRSQFPVNGQAGARNGPGGQGYRNPGYPQASGVNGGARNTGTVGRATGNSYQGTNGGTARFNGGQRPNAYNQRQGFRVGMRPPMRSRSGRVYVYHGRSFAPFRVGRYYWPQGYYYRRYTVGYRLPRMFWLPNYYILDYGDYGLPPPGEGLQWIRYGPDMLLVNTYTGQVVDAVYGAFEEAPDIQDMPDGYGPGPDGYGPGPDAPQDDQPPPQ